MGTVHYRAGTAVKRACGIGVERVAEIVYSGGAEARGENSSL